MNAASTLVSTLRQRLRISPSESSVAGSLPILFFGDALSARLATIGINPSKFEYLHRNGQMLKGKNKRFASIESLDAVSREALSDFQADRAIDDMRSYFDDGKPVYGSYFRHLHNFLDGMGTSYGSRSVSHLDLVQEATDPIWSQIGSSERTALLDRDVPFLVWQLENLTHLEGVICAGKTVSDELRARISVDVKQNDKMKRIRWWSGIAHLERRDLPICGWNYPLDRPTGLGTVGEKELGRMLGRFL